MTNKLAQNPLLNRDIEQDAREILVRNYLDSNLPHIFGPLIDEVRHFGPHAQAELAFSLYLLLERNK